MNTGLTIFQSRFARRLFTLFVSSAILPIIVLAVFSYFSVSDQLLEHRKKQLFQDTKAAGMAIFERLTYLENNLNLVSALMSDNKEEPVENLSGKFTQTLEAQFRSLGITTELNTYKPLFGTVNRSLIVKVTKENSHSLAETNLLVLHNVRSDPAIFMVQKVGSASNGHQLVVGEINPAYLWNTNTLLANQTFCILADSTRPLFCSTAMPNQFFDKIGSEASHISSGSFDWKQDNKGILVSYWGLFLQNRYHISDWTITLSEEEKYVLEPILSFQKMFLAVVALSLLVALMISFNQIVRVLTPLQKLRHGAIEIGNRNFQNNVIVNSNDEFEELADAFNSMSNSIHKQFRSLETISEIDRQILSASNEKTVVVDVLMKIRNVILCDSICIAIKNDANHFEISQTHTPEPNDESATKFIDLTDSDRQIMNDNKQGIVIKLQDSIPLYLRALVHDDDKTCFVLPLFIEDKLFAVMVSGYRHFVDNAEEKLLQIRGWANRIAVALASTKKQKDLFHQAHHDALTDLPNRLAMQNHLQQAIDRANRNQTLVGFLIIDLNRFKLINDSLGHAVGDHYLEKIAAKMDDCIRTSDMVARLGGDEFAVVISDNPDLKQLNTSVTTIAQKLLRAIHIPVFVDGHQLQCTSSIGVSIYPRDGISKEELMINADAAMYAAKTKGGNNYQFYSQEMNRNAKQRLEIETELRTALNNDELILYYQPQVDASGDVIGAEALIRWQHPDKGLISPGVFIPLAEETMLIKALDKWVLRNVCSQIKEWETNFGSVVTIAVNCSSRSFQEEDFVGNISTLVENYGISYNNIELEITEGALIEDVDRTLSTLNKLKDLGLQLAIDDFGTGYSSLSYLKQFPIHKLKIDQSFVRNLSTSESDRAIVKTIINLTNDLGLKCLAEGVETQAELDFLVDHGCNEVQGYLFSRPMPAHEFSNTILAGGQVPPTK